LASVIDNLGGEVDPAPFLAAVMSAAAIATCIARRAMCRKIGCGISSSPPPG
jgi:hypothetical protein